MRFFTLPLLLFLLAASAAQAQMKTIFHDDFNDNKSDWIVGSNDKNAASISGGFYEWEHKTSGGYYYYMPMALDPIHNFIIESKITLVSGAEYGLIWGLEDVDNLYEFTIRDRKFKVFHYEDGLSYTAKDYTSSPAINSGKGSTNVLTVKRDGNILRYLINGTLVFEEPYKRMHGANVGFTIWDQAKIRIDYLDVQEEKEPINLVKNLPTNIKIENLGANVNTIYTDYIPVISSDAKRLWFSRKGDPANVINTEKQDIWYSDLQPDGTWGKAVNAGRPLNNEAHNCVYAALPDGNTLLVINTYKPDGSLDGGGISIAHRGAKGWNIPQKVVMDNYYNRDPNRYAEYTMAPDQSVILMTVQRDETYGERDIYVTFRRADGTFTEPKNIGGVVNTWADEESPFLAADGITLYFSSPGHSGYGDNDIFVTRRLDDTWTNWSTPENLGPNINTPDWDAYYSVSADGKFAYFSSTQNSIGRSDLFRVVMPEDAKPRPVALVKGKVLNADTKKPVDADITYHNLADGKQAGIASSDPSTGDYQIALPFGKEYGFLAAANGYIAQSENLDLRTLDRYKDVIVNLYLTPLKAGETVKLNNVFFVQSKPELLSTSYPELDKLVKIMKDNPSMNIEIEGHTDNVGDAAKNLALSEERAKVVKNYIVNKGISATRITTKGYGGTKPIAPNTTEETRKQNRRVEFKITKI